MGTNRQRKKLFVDPAVQGALLRRLILHWFYALIALFACLFFGQILSTGMENSLGAQLALMWENYGIVLIAMLCLFPAFAYDSLKLSNRFAGPMYSMRVALQKLGRGEDIKPLSFRRGDFWTEIAADVNRIAERLRQPEPESEPESESEHGTERWEAVASSYASTDE
jgi:hypothetical protein